LVLGKLHAAHSAFCASPRYSVLLALIIVYLTAIQAVGTNANNNFQPGAERP
jgi:hypothetical protein